MCTNLCFLFFLVAKSFPIHFYVYYPIHWACYLHSLVLENCGRGRIFSGGALYLMDYDIFSYACHVAGFMAPGWTVIFINNIWAWLTDRNISMFLLKELLSILNLLKIRTLVLNIFIHWIYFVEQAVGNSEKSFAIICDFIFWTIATTNPYAIGLWPCC